MSDLPTLTEATLWAILNEELDDDTVNHLVWHHLGYRYDAATEQWDASRVIRSEEHTSELQSLTNLVCRLLLEKKKTPPPPPPSPLPFLSPSSPL